MKIEVGKYYRTRDGRKVGPLERGIYGWARIGDVNRFDWYDDGFCRADHEERPNDIIAEWTDATPNEWRIVTEQPNAGEWKWLSDGVWAVRDKAEIVTMYWGHHDNDAASHKRAFDEYVITFTVNNDEPDVTTIKMERIE
jgi:hypothetical protein